MPRKQQLIVIGIAALAILGIIAGIVHWRRGLPQPPQPLAATGSAVAPSSGLSAPAASSQAPEPLPKLVPGNPLTDERFAEMSAKIVIAALGLKKDKDWEVNVAAYMAKVLDQEGITEAQYRQYAEALNKNPDRGRAVADNTIRLAEKKLHYKITMDKLPMFKIDDQKRQRIEKRLNPK